MPFNSFVATKMNKCEAHAEVHPKSQVYVARPEDLQECTNADGTPNEQLSLRFFKDYIITSRTRLPHEGRGAQLSLGTQERK